MLSIQLLGGFRIQEDGNTVTTLVAPRLQGLLAYLLLHRQTPHLRQHLAFRFWPHSSEGQALANLRGELHKLRHDWPQADTYVDIQRQWVQWRAEAPVTLDVSELERLVTLADQAAQQRHLDQAIAALEQAVALYRGPLLPDCYEDWIAPDREALARRFAHALDSLSRLLETQGNIPGALLHAQRLLRQDPLREESYQRLIHLHALAGDRAGALRTYHEGVAVLARELGVEPSVALRNAYAQVMNEAVVQPPVVGSAGSPAQRADPDTLVGRRHEWQQLVLAWQRASQGAAMIPVAFITGEAGIGKTRLAESLASWARRQGVRVAQVACYEEGSFVYAPLIELLRSDAIAPSLPRLSEVWLTQVARLLPELVEHQPRLKTGGSADPLQRRLFTEALARAVLADGQPLLLIMDDLHWCDHETLEWLAFVTRYASQARLLLVITARSEEVPAAHPVHILVQGLRRRDQVVEAHLARLDPADTAALASQLTGRALSPGEAEVLYRQSEGNPLFVVEIVRAEVDRMQPDSARAGAQPSGVETGEPLPAGVKAVIGSRLARLSPLAQQVAQVAAAIGRSFSTTLVAKAGGYTEDELVQGLDELWQRQIIRGQGVNAYNFSHSKIRDVAYGLISPPRRQALHRRIAQALEMSYQQDLDPASSQIAAHYETAGEIDRAIVFYRRAARFAQQAYANRQALESIRKAATLLARLPASDDHLPQAVSLQLELAFALSRVKGISDPETEEAYREASALCRRAGAERQLFEASWGLSNSFLLQGDWARALEASESCWHLAQQTGDPELLLQAHHTLWSPYFHSYTGPHGLQSAVEHARQGIALYRPEWHRDHVIRYGGHDPGVCAYSTIAHAQWLLGYPDQAVETMRQALALATQFSHPFTLAQTLTEAAKVHWYRGEPTAALRFLDQSRAKLPDEPVSEESAWRGWVLGRLTPGPEAVALIQQVLSRLQGRRRKMELPAMLALLAETYEAIGDLASAREAIEQGIAIANETGEDYYKPELYRLRGAFLQATGGLQAAEAGFQTALLLAQGQGAKSLELRAATSLAALWAAQGKRPEAHALLAPIYTWFTEGHDTADLRQASDLLAALAP